MIPLPLRLQLSRRKGFNLQALSRSVNGLPAVNCARPGKWGNPWSVAGAREAGYTGSDVELAAVCVNMFRNAIEHRLPAVAPIVADIDHLRGKNLACWCEPGSFCHADVLLVLANAPKCEEARG